MNWDREEDGARQDKGALGHNSTIRVDKFKTFLKEINFLVLMYGHFGANFPKLRRYFWRRAAVSRPMSFPTLAEDIRTLI